MRTRLELEIISHAPTFAKYARCRVSTGSYLYFDVLRGNDYMTFAIYRTSAHCYRVMRYISYCGISVGTQYISFRSIQELCLYLEQTVKTVLNK